MRRLVSIALLAVTQASLAQQVPGPEADTCNVIVQGLDVSESGEFVRPQPTDDQCLFAADLISRLLRADSRDFRRSADISRAPGGVRTQVGAGVDRLAAIVWISDQLVIVAYATEDLNGPVTKVLVTDREHGTACEYPRWPTGETPRQLSLRKIQDVLKGGLGSRPAPTCYLRELPED